MTPIPDLDQADSRDLDRLAEVVAAAFTDLAPSLWLLPGPADRRRIFPRYFRLYLELGLAAGTVHTNPQGTAAAIWLPVTPTSRPELPDYERRLAEVTGEHADRFHHFDNILDEHHPVQPHEWLAILAVHPAEQGRGVGSRLLEGYHRLLDRDGRSAYLEAANRRCRYLYRRHGYADRGQPIRLPDGPAMYPMWRQPQHAAPSTAGTPGAGGS